MTAVTAETRSTRPPPWDSPSPVYGENEFFRAEITGAVFS
jgi:hypothetical protein